MCCERGVVAAAVLCVQHKRDVEHLGFQRGELFIGTQNTQNIFGGGKLRLRLVNVKTFAVVIVAIRLIAVDGKKRKNGDELNALAQYVRDGDVIRGVVIGIHRQHAAGEGVHHVAARRFHDDVAHEICG